MATRVFRIFLPINIVKTLKTVIGIDKLGRNTIKAQAYLPNNAIDLAEWIMLMFQQGEIRFVGPYCSDAEAALNGVVIGGTYELCKKNLYGMKEGTIKTRRI
jgi:hypothetical protein